MDINPVSSALKATFASRNTGGGSPISVDSPPPPVPASRSAPPASDGLGEIQTPVPAVSDVSYPDAQTQVLKEETGSGNLPVKVATAIYVLNHSFDEQKGVLDLIA